MVSSLLVDVVVPVAAGSVQVAAGSARRAASVSVRAGTAGPGSTRIRLRAADGCPENSVVLRAMIEIRC